MNCLFGGLLFQGLDERIVSHEAALLSWLPPGLAAVPVLGLGPSICRFSSLPAPSAGPPAWWRQRNWPSDPLLRRT